MARLVWTGAEFADNTLEANIPWASPLGSSPAPTRDTGVAKTGTASWKCDSGAGNAASYLESAITSADGRTTYLKADFYLPSVTAPSANVYVMHLTDGGGGRLGWQFKTDGTLSPVFGGTNIGTPFTPVVNTWYRLEMGVTLATGANETVEMRVDGVTAYSGTQNAFTATSLTATFGWGASGLSAPGANRVIYVDNIVINDSTGANQNTWAGDTRIVLLKPISDNARATLWTGGAGGTTNLWDAVDNTPPVGTATETNTTQIEHAGGAAGTTDAYDANLTTYASAGLQYGDTVNCALLFAAHGEDSGTGTKLLNFEVVSNPTIASSGNVTAGGDVGALGTYPSNWAIHVGTLTYAPSVTVGTSPVMRARRPETASRVASVCFMGLLLDYTPNTLPILVTAPKFAP